MEHFRETVMYGRDSHIVALTPAILHMFNSDVYASQVGASKRAGALQRQAGRGKLRGDQLENQLEFARKKFSDRA
jgi:hypothetical protein